MSPNDQLVTILATGDRTLLAIAKGILDDAGIRYLAQGEQVQDLFGAGTAFTGYNPIVGPIELKVLSSDVEHATDLLKQLEADDLDVTDNPSS